MKSELKDDYERIMERFYNFNDGIISAISLKYEENGSRHIEIHVLTRDSETLANDGWVSVRITVGNVSEFGVRESPRTSIQVLSQGIHVVRIGKQVGIEFGGAIDCPETFETLRSSDGYVIGQQADFQVGPYPDSTSR